MEAYQCISLLTCKTSCNRRNDNRRMNTRRPVFRSPWAAFMSGALLMGLAQMVGQRALHNYGASEENEAYPRALLRRQLVDPSRSAAAQAERVRVAPEELSPRPSPSSPAVGSFRPSLSLSSSPATGSAVRRRSLEQLALHPLPA